MTKNGLEMALNAATRCAPIKLQRNGAINLLNCSSHPAARENNWHPWSNYFDENPPPPSSGLDVSARDPSIELGGFLAAAKHFLTENCTFSTPREIKFDLASFPLTVQTQSTFISLAGGAICRRRRIVMQREN